MRVDLHIVQSIAVAIVLGALIAAWAFQHFHAPHRTEDIRFSVPQQRYFVAVGMHVSVILAIYAMLVLAIYPVVVVATYEADLIGCWTCIRNRCDDRCKYLQPDSLVWAALMAALFIRIVVPNLAITRHVLDRLRSQTHDLALFPFARESLVTALSVPGFAVPNESDAELKEKMARYGVAPDSLSFLSGSVQRSVLEVCSVRRQLMALLDRSHAFKESLWDRIRFVMETLLAADRPPAKDDELPNSRLLRRFWRAHAASLLQLETGFQRLIRRSARALILAEEISEHVKDEALCLATSNFVADESADVLASYRSLIAEAALSCVPHREGRVEFLKSFGYETPAPPSLPLRPWVIVFGLDFLLFLIPSVLMNFIGENPEFPMVRLAAFACVHAISQTVAITWALYPKIVSNFARPSQYSLPWQSYVVCGLGSYVTGAIILFIFRLYIHLPYPIILPTLLSSVSFLLMTVGMSVLIDLRLQSGSLDFEEGRVREGAVVASLMLAGTLTFQTVMFYVGPRLHLVDPIDDDFNRLILVTFLLLSGSLGFVMGYFVPSAAAAYLQKTTWLARDQLKRSILADSLRRNNAKWAPASSAQPSLQA